MKKEKLLSFALCFLMLLPFFLTAAGTFEADAATLADISAESVFLKQMSSNTCTLCANTMLLRRAAVIRGDSDWQNITELTTRSALWYEGVGMYYSYTYKNISVDSETISGSKTTVLKNLLAKHPEGIVIYDYAYPHAILLTDYTDGKFYCADPANNTPKGRISVDQSLIKVEDADCYWYVTTDLPSLSNGADVKNNSTLNKTVIALGDTVKISGAASGGVGGYQYEYYVQTPSASSWTTLSKFSSSTSYTYKPTAKGDYKLKVAVKDSAGIRAEKTFSLTVNASLVNNTTISKTNFNLGETVTVKGAASGGTGTYQYEFYYKRSTSSEWVKFGSASSASFKPTAIGTFNIRVYVKDSVGASSVKNFTLTASSDLVNNTTVSKTNFKLGETVTIKGAASGGTGTYEYEFYYKRSTSSEWVKFGAASSASFKPTAIGTFNIRVYVKDSVGASSVKNFTLTASSDLVNNTTVSKTNFKLGETVTIKGAASGGTGTYEYEFYYKRSASSEWVKFGAASSATFKPSSVGTFNIRVYVKDNAGNTAVKNFTVSAYH